MGMGQDHAKFTAEIAKGIGIKENSVEVKLLIPLKAAQEHLIFLSSNQGEKINVFLGDPQGSFNFEDDDPMYQNMTGRYVTTDASGVVTKVEKLEGQDDTENQQDLFDQGSEPEGGSSAEEQDESHVGDDDASDQDQDSTGLNNEVPDWMTEDGKGEMNFTDGGNGQEPDGSEDELTDYEREIMGESSGNQPEDEVDISKEQLEEYILLQRPTFPDVDLDFPSLVEKRRNGATWLGLSKELGIPSSQLNTKFKKYKDAVKKLMKNNGAA